jgi:hypothetical protein
MNANELKEVYHAAPFQPFDVVLTNGTRVPIQHPEFMAFSRDCRTISVSKLKCGLERIDVEMVIAIDDSPNGSRSSKRKR